MGKHQILTGVVITDVNHEKKSAKINNGHDFVSLIELNASAVGGLSISSLHEYLKSRDENNLLPTYLGCSLDRKYLITDFLEFISQRDEIDQQAFFHDVFESILFLHSNGWCGVELGRNNIAFNSKYKRYQLLNFNNLGPTNFMTNTRSYSQLINDYRNFYTLFQQVAKEKSFANHFEFIELLGNICTSTQDNFYQLIEKLCEVSEIDIAQYCQRPWFSPVLERGHEIYPLGNTSFSFVKGYSGVGKSHLLSKFLANKKSSPLNTIVIRCKKSNESASVECLLKGFDSWIKRLEASANEKIQLFLKNEKQREENYLFKVFSNLNNEQQTTIRKNSKVNKHFFKFQLLNFVNKVSKVLSEHIFIVYHEFDSASKVTIDFLEFCSKESNNNLIRNIVFYKDFWFGDNKALELLERIEKEAINIEKVAIPPLSIDETKNLLSYFKPPKLLHNMQSNSIHNISMGNPLFIKVLMLTQREVSNFEKGSFIGLYEAVLSETLSTNQLFDCVKVLSVFGKPLKLDLWFDLSEMKNIGDFESVILNLLSFGILTIENEKIWFSHDKFEILTSQLVEVDWSIKMSNKIVRFLLRNEYTNVVKTDLIYDVAYHASRSLSLVENAHDAEKICSISFTAALRCIDVGAMEEASGFMVHALEASRLAFEKYGHLDEKLVYAMEFEYAFLLKAVGKLDESVEKYLSLLKKSAK